MSEARPVLFGGAHIRQAINDDNFYRKLPQFLTIKAKINALHENLSSKKGCPTCRQKRVQNTVERDFAAIASSLDAASGKIFKEYFGVPRMVIHAVNPVTHAAYLKEI